MSQEKRKAAQETQTHIKNAEVYIEQAKRSADKTGDKTLIQKVTKIGESLTETRKELGEKLNG